MHINSERKILDKIITVSKDQEIQIGAFGGIKEEPTKYGQHLNILV